MLVVLEVSEDRRGVHMLHFCGEGGRVNILLSHLDMDPIRQGEWRGWNHGSGRIVTELGHLLIESIGAASETDEVRQFISLMRNLGLAYV